MFEDFERYYLNGAQAPMISTNELTAHILGTFEGRLEIAKRNHDRDPTEKNQLLLNVAEETYNTLYGIVYEFDEANSQGDY
jgi:hypothetical protein